MLSQNKIPSKEKVSLNLSKERRTSLNTILKEPFVDSEDALLRVKALEYTVYENTKSNNEEMRKLQDRLYQQELRYEETLTKFDEVIGNLAATFSYLQQSTVHPTSKNAAATTVNETIETMENITKNSKRVQFKGILKPE